MSVLTTGVRTPVRVPPNFKDRPARRDTRFCYSVHAKTIAMEKEDEMCLRDT